MNLNLTKSQFLELMRLTFIGEFIINGHKTEDFDIPAQDFREWLIEQAVAQGIMDYVEQFHDDTYDYSNEKSGEFFELVEDYCEEDFHTDLVEIVAQNIIYDTLGGKAIEKMSPTEYDKVFERTANVVNKEFQKNDYDNLIIKTGK